MFGLTFLGRIFFFYVSFNCSCFLWLIALCCLLVVIVALVGGSVFVCFGVLFVVLYFLVVC